MDSYCLSFQTEELIQGLENVKNYIYDSKRKTWLKDYPEIILEIDSQLRKYFNVKDSRKLSISVYNIKNNEKLLRLHDVKENIVNRIIISTSSKYFKTNKGKKYLFNSWEAYEIQDKINDKLVLYVDRDKKKKTKTSEMVLVFEYIFNSNEFDNILESLNNLS